MNKAPKKILGVMAPRNTTFIALLSAGMLAGCVVGPDYHRPKMDLPESWPAASQPNMPVTDAGERWWSLYADPVLDKLEEEALEHNVDIKVAAARVLETRAQLGITESDQYPSVSANVRESRTESSLNDTFPRPATIPRIQNFTHATLNASYELDLWGRLRRADEASRAGLLAAESAKETVRLSLAAQVAQQYFTILSCDAQETVVRRILDGRQERVVLNKKRFEVGVISEYDLHQAKADEAAIQSQLATLIQARNKQEAVLALLLGRSPREVMNGKLERGSPGIAVASIPEGLPAELLLRRPDLKEAELRLVALNASIGVARSQFFPSVTLTSYFGSESTVFSNLFSGPAGIFQFAANVTQPIFNANRVEFMVKAAEAQREQALAQYQQTVASAFADVRNALSEQEAARKVLASESARSKALAQAYKQAGLRYQGAISSRMELLDVEQNYLQAELNRLDAERAQRVAVADLFKALGGGWQSSDKQSSTEIRQEQKP